MEVSVHRMKRQIATGSLAVRSTTLALISSAWPAGFAVAMPHAHTGLTHRAAIIHHRTIAPGTRISERALRSHGRRRRSTAGHQKTNRPRKQHGNNMISHRKNSLFFVGNFIQQSSSRRPPGGSKAKTQSRKRHRAAVTNSAYLDVIGRRIVESSKIPTNPPEFDQED